MIFIDLETRSLADLKATGATRYAQDESTEVLVMAWCEDDGPMQVWLPGAECPFDTNQQIVAHNAAFERVLWDYCLRPKYQFPAVPIRNWVCTMSMALAAGLPRALDHVATALDLKLNKDKEGRMMMLKWCKPKRDGTWADDPEEFKKLVRYCKQDVELERRIYNRLPKLTSREQGIYTLDQKINNRGITVDLDLCEAAIAMEDREVKALNAELREITGGAVKTGRQVKAVLEFLATLDCHLLSLNKADVQSALDGPLGDVPRRVLEIRQLVGKASTSKFKKMLSMQVNGRIHDQFIYHGAITGRWAGSGVQLQNLQRETFPSSQLSAAVQTVKEGQTDLFKCSWGSLQEGLGKLVRPALVAPKGKVLGIVDYSQIEARIVAWLAGQTDLVELFASGSDVYRHMASRIFDVAPEEVTSEQRFYGKTVTLGFGYGMGKQMFIDTCERFGRTISRKFSDDTVTFYREHHPHIRNLWYSTLETAIQAVRGEPIEYGTNLEGERAAKRWKARSDLVVTSQPVAEDGRVNFQVFEDGWLYCQLPSGRCLRYYQPEVVLVRSKDRFQNKEFESISVSYTAGGHRVNEMIRKHLWAGHLIENITQALARDFLVEAIIRLERAGYPVVAHVHDEVVVELDEPEELSIVESIMREVPQWGSGCPIEVEGSTSDRYGKG